jgi:clan AA aspartic protease (TIGR02281 family)
MKHWQVSILILLFGLAVVSGWLLGDRLRSTGSEEQPVAREQTSVDPQVGADSLIRALDAGLIAQAIRTAEHLISSGDADSEEVNHLIDTAAGRLIRQRQYSQARILLQGHYSKFNPTLQGLILLARCHAESEEYQEQISTLFQAKLLADSSAEEEQVSSLVKNAVSGYSRFLVTLNRWGDLDLFYQELIYEEPDNPDHYLQLALLRMRVGDLDGALDPLARIENDPHLGEQARRLMAKVQHKNELVPVTAAEIPLLAHGSQFIVKARLDNYRDLNLLIDTGAAITVIEPRLLAELGYRLDGEVQYFNTANGTIKAPMVDVRDLSFGSIAFKELPVAAVNLGMSGHIDGLLGMNFLRHYQFRIDQDDKVLFLNPIAR